MELVVIAAIFLVINGFIGWLIGRGKGRGTAGFWWGVLMGWIGWIVAACMQPSLEVRKREAIAIKEALGE